MSQPSQKKQREAAETKASFWRKWKLATLIAVGVTFAFYLIANYNQVNAAEVTGDDIPEATDIEGPPTPPEELGFLDRVTLGAVFAFNGDTSPLLTVVGDDFDARMIQLSTMEMLTTEEHRSLLEDKEAAVDAQAAALTAKGRWLNYLESAKGCLAVADGGNRES